MSLWSTPVLRRWWAHYNRFIFPAPNHSLLRARDRFLSRFLPPWEPLFLCLKRARTHSGTCWARGVIYKGFFLHPFFLFFSYFLMRSTCWAANYHLAEPDLQYFICYLLSNRLAGGRASAGGAVCANDFKATQDQRLLKLIIIWIVFKLITIWITSLRQLFLR